METAESDIEVTSNQLATPDEIDLFTCTAHNRKAAGYYARHATNTKLSKKCNKILDSNSPMKLGEGQRLIKRILIEWIKLKIRNTKNNGNIKTILITNS